MRSHRLVIPIKPPLGIEGVGLRESSWIHQNATQRHADWRLYKFFSYPYRTEGLRVRGKQVHRPFIEERQTKMLTDWFLGGLELTPTGISQS